MARIPQVVDHVNIPVIVAGGVMDSRGWLASHALGAQGVDSAFTRRRSGRFTLSNTK
ncbi:TPA: nitronate monooxygenase [Escherichia coli]|nr:nitronate monooxygenase [Escherichia coli]